LQHFEDEFSGERREAFGFCGLVEVPDNEGGAEVFEGNGSEGGKEEGREGGREGKVGEMLFGWL